MAENDVLVRMSRAEARELVDELREPLTGHIRPQSFALIHELEQVLVDVDAIDPYVSVTARLVSTAQTEGDRLDDALVAGEV